MYLQFQTIFDAISENSSCNNKKTLVCTVCTLAYTDQIPRFQAFLLNSLIFPWLENVKLSFQVPCELCLVAYSTLHAILWFAT